MSDADVIPLRPADEHCNARLARRSGYCQNKSGAGTDHLGYGRCSVHEDGRDGNRDDLLKALGLAPIVVTAELLSRDDQEYLMHVSNNALVIQRAMIAQAMSDGLMTPKEKKEAIEAIAKIDAILAKHTNEIASEQTQAQGAEAAAEAAEFERLKAI